MKVVKLLSGEIYINLPDNKIDDFLIKNYHIINNETIYFVSKKIGIDENFIIKCFELSKTTDHIFNYLQYVKMYSNKFMKKYILEISNSDGHELQHFIHGHFILNSVPLKFITENCPTLLINEKNLTWICKGPIICDWDNHVNYNYLFNNPEILINYHEVYINNHILKPNLLLNNILNTIDEELFIQKCETVLKIFDYLTIEQIHTLELYNEHISDIGFDHVFDIIISKYNINKFKYFLFNILGNVSIEYINLNINKIVSLGINDNIINTYLVYIPGFDVAYYTKLAILCNIQITETTIGNIICNNETDENVVSKYITPEFIKLNILHNKNLSEQFLFNHLDLSNVLTTSHSFNLLTHPNIHISKLIELISDDTDISEFIEILSLRNDFHLSEIPNKYFNYIDWDNIIHNININDIENNIDNINISKLIYINIPIFKNINLEFIEKHLNRWCDNYDVWSGLLGHEEIPLEFFYDHIKYYTREF